MGGSRGRRRIASGASAGRRPGTARSTDSRSSSKSTNSGTVTGASSVRCGPSGLGLRAQLESARTRKHHNQPHVLSRGRRWTTEWWCDHAGRRRSARASDTVVHGVDAVPRAEAEASSRPRRQLEQAGGELPPDASADWRLEAPSADQHGRARVRAPVETAHRTRRRPRPGHHIRRAARSRPITTSPAALSAKPSRGSATRRQGRRRSASFEASNGLADSRGCELLHPDQRLAA